MFAFCCRRLYVIEITVAYDNVLLRDYYTSSILLAEIPCTRKHEEWDACPPPCFSDSCYSFNNQPVICEELHDPYCRPGCRCKKEYGREYKNLTCIIGTECRKLFPLFLPLFDRSDDRVILPRTASEFNFHFG